MNTVKNRTVVSISGNEVPKGTNTLPRIRQAGLIEAICRELRSQRPKIDLDQNGRFNKLIEAANLIVEGVDATETR